MCRGDSTEQKESAAAVCRSVSYGCLNATTTLPSAMLSMARLRTPAASLQCNNLTMFQLYLQKTQESILQQLISELELEILALAQEIINVARLLLGQHGF